MNLGVEDEKITCITNNITQEIFDLLLKYKSSVS